MLKVDVLNKEGRKMSTVDLQPEIFAVKVNPAVVHRAVVAQLSKKDVTAKAKDRSEVRGGGIKPWKQKGTGRARAGSIRSPLWRGGGKTFGPMADKNNIKKINKREKRRAVHMALSDKLTGKNLMVVDDLKMAEMKTKDFVKVLKNLKIDKKALILIKDKDERTLKSARNLAGIKVLLVGLLNVYDIIRYDQLIIEKKALDQIK